MARADLPLCPGQAGYLIDAGLARQRRAVGVRGVDRVGEPVFCVGHLRPRLLFLITRWEVGSGSPAAVAYGGRLQDVAEVVHLQRQGMGDTRIGGVTLVVILDRLPCMGEQDRVPVLTTGLEAFERVIAFRDAIRVWCFVRAVEGVDLLPDDGALQSP